MATRITRNISSAFGSVRPGYRLPALCAAGVILLVLSAKAQVPFWPVPLTLQTLALSVLVVGYGGRLGTATVAAYVALGAFGLPVFAGTPEKGIGLAYMAGPTGGYLAGFILAAALMGGMADRGWKQGILRITAAMTLGNLLILVVGTMWLAVLFGPAKAVAVGFVPFLWPGIVKVLLGALIVHGITRVLRDSRD